MTAGRRKLLIGGIGAAAAAAGAGFAWFSRTSEPAADSAALWQASFTQPDGEPLVMASLHGTPLVLNFWATWCPPCVKEMPELDRFARAYAARGVRVVGVAIDNPAPVREFLRRTPVSYSIGLGGFEGTELSRKLGNERGGLPFTAFFDRRGVLTERRLGETSFAELARWAESA